MPDTPDGLTAREVIAALEEMSNQAGSDGSISGLLHQSGIETTLEVVRAVAGELTAKGMLKLVGRKGDGKRYQLLGPNAVYRHVRGE